MFYYTKQKPGHWTEGLAVATVVDQLQTGSAGIVYIIIHVERNFKLLCSENDADQ